MWIATLWLCFALVVQHGKSAFDDVFRTVKEQYDEKLASGATGLSVQSDWCQYRMRDSNRTLVKLHYDMVIDQSTYDEIFRKEYYFEHEGGGSCLIHSVVGEHNKRRRRNAAKNESKRWPLVIPYEINPGIDDKGRATILTAMQHWSSHTCLNFVPRQDQFDRIIFEPEEWGCESYVGRMIGPQYISLHPQNCMTMPIVLHEIGHAIGLYHEHTRADRDEYVTVNYEHILQDNHYNFDKLLPDKYFDFNKTYDYRSIMHYGKHFFANPAEVISLEPKNEDYLDIIGEAERLSFHDVQIVNAMYKCAEKCAPLDCPEGAFLGKNCECFCKGPPEDPVVRCKEAVFCEAPDIDLSTYFVFNINKENNLDDLSGTRYPEGTVLILEDRRCSQHGTGNYTCRGGDWVVNLNCKQDRCVYNTSRYHFKPNITADAAGPVLEYVDAGTRLHVDCIAPTRVPSKDSKCVDSQWVPELPNCDEAIDCEIENLNVQNVEIVIQGKVQTAGELIPDGSSVLARCKKSDQLSIPVAQSITQLVCTKGQMEGQLPTPCPTTFYACPIVHFSTISGPFNNGFDVKCFNRYEMLPRLEQHFDCDWKGVWHPFVPKCSQVKCLVNFDEATAEVKTLSRLEVKPNSLISSGQTIIMSCTKRGHVPDHVTLTCDHGNYAETSNSQLPVCKQVTCRPPNLPDSIKYERATNDTYLFKDSVRITRCQGNLWFQGDTSLTCTNEGKWNGTAKCIPYCEHGTERMLEKPNSHLIKYVIHKTSVENYDECLSMCKTFKRILCRAIAYGFEQGIRKCHITYVDPNHHAEMVGNMPFWSVWIRQCD